MYYGNVFYGFLPVVQKVSLVACIGWILSLHYARMDQEPAHERSALVVGSARNLSSHLHSVTKIVEGLNGITEAAKAGDPNARLSVEETSFMQMSRSVVRKKGRWDRFGAEVE